MAVLVVVGARHRRRRLAWPNPWHLALFLVGAIAMRGAGCTYNDIVDRDLDAQVARTRSRPIPSGQVSVGQARASSPCRRRIGLAVLLQFNRFTVLLGVASLAIVAIYPFMKRVTDWPQLALGISFSWGALMGWAAIFGRARLAAASCSISARILWTIGYDTIYAHQDKEDDALVGVRSTARLFGARTRPVLALFYAGATILFAAAVWAAGLGPLAYARPCRRRRAPRLAGRDHRHRRSGQLPEALPLQPRLTAGSSSPAWLPTALLALIPPALAARR